MGLTTSGTNSVGTITTVFPSACKVVSCAATGLSVVTTRPSLLRLDGGAPFDVAHRQRFLPLLDLRFGHLRLLQREVRQVLAVLEIVQTRVAHLGVVQVEEAEVLAAVEARQTRVAYLRTV